MTHVTNKSSRKYSPSIRSGLATGVLVGVLALSGADAAIADDGGIGSGGGDGGSDTSSGDRDGNKYDKMWRDFSRKDRKWAKKTSECESGGDPNAYNPSGPYYGAFQFLKSTWESSPSSPGGKPTRYNWTTQAVVAVKLKKRDGAGHWPVCG